MDILFYLSYVVIPLIISAGYFLGSLKVIKTSLVANFHLYKGIFSIYLVLITLSQVIKGVELTRYAIGLPLGLGIMDATDAIVEGINRNKEYNLSKIKELNKKIFKSLQM